MIFVLLYPDRLGLHIPVMAKQNVLSSVLEALEFPTEGRPSIGGYFSSSIDNKEFQKQAKAHWLPKVLENLQAVKHKPNSNEVMIQVLFDEKGAIKDFQFLTAQLISKQSYDSFDVFVGSMDITLPGEPTTWTANEQGKDFYDADVIITAQFEVFVDRINKEEFLCISNLLYTGVSKEEVDNVSQRVPRGCFNGFFQLKYHTSPRLYAPYGRVKSGKELELDEETMVYVTNDKKPQRVLSGFLYMLAYQRARFPDTRLLEIFEPAPTSQLLLTDAISMTELTESEEDEELLKGVEDYLANLEKEQNKE